MGLAASQARLLFITMRQNDVSARMQKISNDKLVLARDEEEVSDKYNRMLNNPNYTYTNADGTNLSYDALMGQTAAVNGATTLITNGERKVVLSPSLASKLGLSGAEGEPGKLPYNSVDELIDVADPDNAEKIKAATASEIKTTPSGSGTLTDQQKNTLDAIKNAKGSYPSIKSGSMSLTSLLKDMGSYSYANVNVSLADQNKYGSMGQLNNGQTSSFVDIANLDGNNSASHLYLLMRTGDISDSDVNGKALEAASKLKSVATEIANKMLKSSGLPACASLYDEVDKMYSQAKSVASGIYDNTGINNNNNRDKDENDAIDIAMQSAKNTIFGFGVDDTGSDDLVFFTDLGVVTKRLLNHLLGAQEGCEKGTEALDSSWNPGINTSKWSGNGQVSVTNVYNDFKFLVRGDHSQNGKDVSFALIVNEKGYNIGEYEQAIKDRLGTVTDEMRAYCGKKADSGSSTPAPEAGSQQYFDNLKTYYTNLFEQLKARGWTTQTADTIQQNLNNGLYSVNGTQISSGGNYTAVKDPDSAAKAEAYYKQEMAKINRKEKEQDTQLQKLQTEYSGLTSDYESVKSILNANIQKSFTYCQQG